MDHLLSSGTDTFNTDYLIPKKTFFFGKKHQKQVVHCQFLMLCLNSEIDLISKQILKNTTETKFIYVILFFIFIVICSQTRGQVIQTWVVPLIQTIADKLPAFLTEIRGVITVGLQHNIPIFIMEADGYEPTCWIHRFHITGTALPSDLGAQISTCLCSNSRNDANVKSATD